jgi:hypothetical protein
MTNQELVPELESIGEGGAGLSRQRMKEARIMEKVLDWGLGAALGLWVGACLLALYRM